MDKVDYYSNNSSVHNFLFHPLYSESIGDNLLSVITNIALTIFSCGLWLIPFIYFNLSDKKIEIIKPEVVEENKQVDSKIEKSPAEIAEPQAEVRINQELFNTYPYWWHNPELATKELASSIVQEVLNTSEQRGRYKLSRKMESMEEMDCSDKFQPPDDYAKTSGLVQDLDENHLLFTLQFPGCDLDTFEIIINETFLIFYAQKDKRLFNLDWPSSLSFNNDETGLLKSNHLIYITPWRRNENCRLDGIKEALKNAKILMHTDGFVQFSIQNAFLNPVEKL